MYNLYVFIESSLYNNIFKVEIQKNTLPISQLKKKTYGSKPLTPPFSSVLSTSCGFLPVSLISSASAWIIKLPPANLCFVQGKSTCSDIISILLLSLYFFFCASFLAGRRREAMLILFLCFMCAWTYNANIPCTNASRHISLWLLISYCSLSTVGSLASKLQILFASMGWLTCKCE